ncbi:competence protein ComEC [Gordonia malaquae]|uniref:Putative ComEC/Rec2-related protein n=1 Tax=Gordonia malaquae NBRC 108250 TaxID=1223542 RepID=M3VGY9_GORML|nr:ComEC/Rec2 family competence protein [Gordonia malaquae]GAC81379.1 putative ComEC/Rec2-related protein [Gordonia malaquae NBRC 108250]SED73417.1 competence protein ComEC [Gordonia malaquae]
MADLRLVAPAAGSWATTAAALVAPVPASVAAVLILVAAAVAVCRVRRWSGIAPTVAAACAVSAAAGVIVILRVVAVDSSPILSAVGKPVVEVTVAGDPTVQAGGRRVTVPVRIERLSGRSMRPVAARLHVDASAADLLPGERIEVRVRARPAAVSGRDLLIAAELSAAGEIRRIRDAPWWQRAAGDVRVRLRELAARALGGRAGGLLPGLVLGDTGGLDQQTRDTFKAAGLSHLLAVSGSNLVLTVGAVVLCVRACGASTRTVFAVGAIAVIGFVVLVRPTDSVLRAAIMGTVGLVAGLTSRRSQALPALGAAVILVVLWWPEMALAPGFALSVAATVGLVVWSAPIRFALLDRGVPDWLASLIAMTLAAQILTTPIVIALTGRVSVFAVLANVLAAPAVPLIGIAGTAAAAIGATGPRFGPAQVPAEMLVRATGPPVRWLLAVGDRLGGPGWVCPEVPGLLAASILVAGGGGAWVWSEVRKARTRRPFDG